MDIQQITLYTHPGTQGRVVLVGLSNGLTYRIQDAGGDPCFNHVTGDTMTPAEMNDNPPLNQALAAVGEFYKFWLSGNEDPMVLMLRKDTPVLHELYESEVDLDGSGTTNSGDSLRSWFKYMGDRATDRVWTTEGSIYARAFTAFEDGASLAKAGISDYQWGRLVAQAKAEGWEMGRDYTGLVNRTESLRAFVWGRSSEDTKRLYQAAGCTYTKLLDFAQGKDYHGLNESDLSDLRTEARKLGWQD